MIERWRDRLTQPTHASGGGTSNGENLAALRNRVRSVTDVARRQAEQVLGRRGENYLRRIVQAGGQ